MPEEESLERPEATEVAVLGARRLHHHGSVEVVRVTRMFRTTFVRVGDGLHPLPRAVAKKLPNEWFSN